MGPIVDTCAICVEAPVYPFITTCNHVFCRNEIMQWLKRQKNCPVCRTAQDVSDLRSNIALKKVASTTANKIKNTIAQTIAEIQNPKELSITEVTDLLASLKIAAKPLTIHVTVFDIHTGSVKKFPMPREPETAHRIKMSLDFDSPICRDVFEIDAPSQADSLIFLYPPTLAELKSLYIQDIQCAPKLYTVIKGIQFHDGLINLCTDVGSFYYRDTQQFRSMLQAAKNSEDFAACVKSTITHLLSQNEYQQIALTTPKELPKPLARGYLQKIHESKIGPANFVDTFDFENVIHPNFRCYVGITKDMPKESPGIPIDLKLATD